MKALATRKAELLLACDLQRQMLELEWGLIQLRLQGIRGVCQKLPATWTWLAPVLGILMARQLRRAPRRVSWAPAKWLILYKLWQAWRLWRKGPGARFPA